MSTLNNLKKLKGINRKRRRRGIGHGSKLGKTAGKGHKGQKARSGGSVSPVFEGGQTPLYQKLPFKRGRGFTNFRFKKTVYGVNVSSLESLPHEITEVDRKLLESHGLMDDSADYLKILGDGELTRSFKVTADLFSASAVNKIEGAGGSVVKLSDEAPKA